MHLILTHEQADFDGIAAAAAVRLLHSDAVAILPRRMNRNVRGFLTLYGERLPFVEPGDVEVADVEQVTLVDTQSMPPPKGLTPTTRVHVIDHHAPAAKVDPSWTTHIEMVGATTTLLVESVREAGIQLDFVTATLLLLGIYEDTGSLTYAGTTARDAHAAAWLLERGANLEIAVEFLSQPLSSEQRELYDRLVESVETHRIHGLGVMIAAARVESMVDEISTLAHKLRDLFEPAALFLLVALDSHVQLVARSTTDAVDVSRVAEHFEGGGHPRAAAAVIRGKSLHTLRDELLQILPGLIVPPRMVGEIMSRDPQLLSPATTVREAAELMQRFGHEGYPVLDEGQVVGLLTRRSVDRALAHGMGAKGVESVMDSGRVMVHPADSLQHLQRLMIESGWGQIPVSDPESGEIVGIVTRTDVLNTLASAVTDAPTSDFTSALEHALPAGRLALLKLVAGEAEARRDALFIVGGFARDLMLGAPSVDFDLVVEGDGIGLAQELSNRYGGKVSSHHRFGTAKWELPAHSQALLTAIQETAGEPGLRDLPASLDFVTARTEFYPHPTALPSVERGSIKLDLHRRDFTINTLALRLDGKHYGQLLNFWGGRQDLKDGLIRVLHSLSFVDDPTRMLRAVRLEQRLGFRIEARTLELLHQALPLLDRVSGDRIRAELLLAFVEQQLPAIMRRLSELDLLAAIHPKLSWDEDLEAQFQMARTFEAPAEWHIESPDPNLLMLGLWFHRLRASDIEEVTRRLSIPGSERTTILAAKELGVRLRGLSDIATPSTYVSLIDQFPLEAAPIVWLAQEASERSKHALARYLGEWRFVTPEIDGTELKALGLPPGPSYGRILWRLRAARLDGEVSTPEAERELLHALLKEALSDG